MGLVNSIKSYWISLFFSILSIKSRKDYLTMNIIILQGNLGSEPEMSYTNSGIARTTFSLAVNQRWTGYDGVQQEKTVWFRITCWRKQAETTSQYLRKGSKVLIQGEAEEAYGYLNRDGENAASNQVTAQKVTFLDPPTHNQAGQPYQPQANNNPMPAPATNGAIQQPAQPAVVNNGAAMPQASPQPVPKQRRRAPQQVAPQVPELAEGQPVNHINQQMPQFPEQQLGDQNAPDENLDELIPF